MRSATLFEKNRIVDRLKSVMILCAFIAASALASAFLMDLIVAPIALLAVGNRELFNIIVAWAVRLGLTGALIYLFVRRIRAMRQDGHSGGSVALYMCARPLRAAGLVLSLMAVSTALIALIYLLFSYNYYFIYKISN